METDITYHRTLTNTELHQILELQRINLLSNLSENEKQAEGFVTVNHSFSVLQAMNNECAHIIAKQNDNVIGYALSMTKSFKDKIDILKPMFKEIDTTLQTNLNYIVMGQICIDKNYRGEGIFRGLYNFMKNELKGSYSAIITEIDVKNTRSINAHKTVGFDTLKQYYSNGQTWEIVILKI